MSFLKRPIAPSLFLALFVLGCVFLAVAMWLWHAPASLVFLGVLGPAYAGFAYKGRFYLRPLTILVLLAVWGIIAAGTRTADSAITAIAAVLVAVAVGEILSQSRRKTSSVAAAVNQSQAMLEEAQSIAHVGHFVRDAETGKGEWSREMFVIYGVEPSQGTPTTADWAKLLHPDDRQRVVEAQQRALKYGDPLDIEYRAVRPDGTVRHLHASGYRKLAQNGDPPLLVGTVADITERTLAIRALREGEERVRSLIENAPISIIVVNDQGIITQTNSHVEEVFGYSPEAIVGQPLDILLPENVRASHRNLFTNFVLNPQAHHIGEKRELVALHKDGRILPVEIGLSAMTIKGRSYSIAWIADISVRRQAEDALRQSEQYFKLLHETSRELSTTLDLDVIHDMSFKAISQVMDCDGLIISSYSSDDKHIRGSYARFEGKRIDPSEFPAVPVEPDKQGPRSSVLRNGVSLVIPNYPEEVTPTPQMAALGGAARAAKLATHSAVLVPLKLDGEVVGVIQVLSYRFNAYSEPHVQFLESLAAHMVVAQKNAILYRRAQQELTERKHAEQALQLSEERYRAISDLTSDYAYSFKVVRGRARSLEWIAGAFAQITGYAADDVAARGGWARLMHRPDIPLLRRHTNSLLANNESVAEFRIVSKSGKIHWLRDQARPIWDEAENRVIRIIGAVEDITDRKHAEEALIESEKLYRSVFEGTSVGLGIVDGEGRILAFNEAMIAPGGYSRADINDIKVVSALYYDITDRDHVLKKLREQGSVSREPVRFKRKDGTPYDTLLSLVQISIEGRPALHAMVEDLTEQKRTEAEIRRLFASQERHLAELEALRRVSLDITGQLDLTELLQQLIKDALGLLDTETGGVYMYSMEKDDLELQLEVGTDPSLVGLRLRRGEGLAGRVLETGQPVIVDDYARWEGRAKIYEGRSFGAILGVPIVWANQMLGVITAIATRPGRTFSRDDAGLLARFADQAAIAIHNARLYETEQKARMVAEMLYATSVALTQSLDLDERLNVFLRNLQILAPYDSANVMLLEPDGRVRIRAAVGYEAYGPGDDLTGMIFDLDNLAGAREVIAKLRTVYIPDTSTFEGWNAEIGSIRIGCWIGVPLIADGEIIGLYSLDRIEAGYFTEEHRYAAETLAAPAAIAIQNARLFESETRQLKLAQTLQQVGALLTTQMQLDEVFEHIIDLLAEVVQFDTVSIFLIDDTGKFNLGAQRGIQDMDRLNRTVHALGRDPRAAHRWNKAETQIVNDTVNDPTWIFIDGIVRTRSWIGAPLIVRGKRIGVLNVDSEKPNAFDGRLAETVTAFANQAAVAIENARLFTQSANRSQRLQLLNEITRIGTETLDLPSLLEGIVKVAAKLIGGDSAAVTLWDDEKRLTTVSAVSGGPSQPFGSIKLTAGLEALTSSALRDGHPLAIEDYYLQAGGTDDEGKPMAASSLLLPLQVGQLNLGVLFIDFTSPHHFTDDEIAWSSQAAELIALAIAKSEVYEDLERRVEQRTAELQSANDRLVTLTRLKDEFVSNVSHELRTPIASIKLYHTLLNMRPEKRDSYLEHLHRETKRLENIVEGLLHLSRLDQGRVELELEPVDLHQLAEQFVADRALLAEQRGLTLSLVTRIRPAPIIGDSALLGQAISVLFTNAMNYTPHGGSISIEASSIDRNGKKGAALAIQDTGPGIKPEEMPRLFERFYRGSAARASAVPGTGLGLAIAQEILERHGGHLEVTSTGIAGEGARFTIWLPGEQGPKPELHAEKPRLAAPGLDVQSDDVSARR